MFHGHNWGYKRRCSGGHDGDKNDWQKQLSKTSNIIWWIQLYLYYIFILYIYILYIYIYRLTKNNTKKLIHTCSHMFCLKRFLMFRHFFAEVSLHISVVSGCRSGETLHYSFGVLEEGKFPECKIMNWVWIPGQLID